MHGSFVILAGLRVGGTTEACQDTEAFVDHLGNDCGHYTRNVANCKHSDASKPGHADGVASEETPCDACCACNGCPAPAVKTCQDTVGDGSNAAFTCSQGTLRADTQCPNNGADDCNTATCCSIKTCQDTAGDGSNAAFTCSQGTLQAGTQCPNNGVDDCNTATCCSIKTCQDTAGDGSSTAFTCSTGTLQADTQCPNNGVDDCNTATCCSNTCANSHDDGLGGSHNCPSERPIKSNPDGIQCPDGGCTDDTCCAHLCSAYECTDSRLPLEEVETTSCWERDGNVVSDCTASWGEHGETVCCMVKAHTEKEAEKAMNQNFQEALRQGMEGNPTAADGATNMMMAAMVGGVVVVLA